MIGFYAHTIFRFQECFIASWNMDIFHQRKKKKYKPHLERQIRHQVF